MESGLGALSLSLWLNPWFKSDDPVSPYISEELQQTLAPYWPD